MPEGEQQIFGVDRPLGFDAESLIFYYNMICSVRGFSFPLHMLPVARALVDQRIEKLMVIIGPGSGKALHPDTPVLCADGWRPIGSLKIGDKVWDPGGKRLNRVREIINQPAEPLWRVRFADGREILAHSDHLWKAHHKKFTRENRGEKGGDGLLWDIVPTIEIAQRLASAKDLMWYIPLVEPIEFAEVRNFLISPYMLGVILGDGHISSTGYSTITNPEIEMGSLLEKEGAPYGITVSRRATNSSGYPVWGLCGSGPALVGLGLRNKRSWEKFIPVEYKTASVAQRLAILQGLMDTDGNVGSGGSPNFSSTSKQLAEDVQELVWSLGGIAKLVERQTFFTSHGERKPGRKSWRVSIRMRDPSILFRVARKRDTAGRSQYADTLKLRIVSIEREQTSSESVCISLDNREGLYIVDNYVTTHNSCLISEVYPGFLLGHDPTMTVLGISAGELLMQGFMRSIMETVEWNPMYRALFPRVRPDKSAGWSSERGMFVTGREIGNPDANFSAAGLDSKSLTGKHGRVLICDDLHDKDNSATIDQCDKVWNTYFNTIIGRADPRGGRYIVAGRRYNTLDIYARLKATGEFVVLELPAERPGARELYFDVEVPDGLVCCFNEAPGTPPGDSGGTVGKRRRMRLPA